jgi:RNA polymerase-binding protein DksA
VLGTRDGGYTVFAANGLSKSQLSGEGFLVAKQSAKSKGKVPSKPVSSKSAAKSVAPVSKSKSTVAKPVAKSSVIVKKGKVPVRPVAVPVVKAAAKSVSKSATVPPGSALSAPKKGAKAKGPEVVVKKPEKPPILPPHRPAVVAAPVPTNGKPRKNQAGLLTKDLEHYRELLLLKRRELVGDMSSMEREALRSTTGTNLSNLPLHMADMGTDNYEQEFTLGLVEKDRQLLREINTALAKIMDGSYGICEGTGKPISKARLEAQPWAKFSIEYARQMEKGMIRR